MDRVERAVGVHLLRALIAAAGRAGIAPDRAVAAIGDLGTSLDALPARISASVMARAWETIPALSGDEAFGLHAALEVPIGSFGALEFAAICARNAYEALRSFVRYYPLLGALHVLDLVERGDEVRLTIRNAEQFEGRSLRHSLENITALLAIRGRVLHDVRPRAVAFAHPAPGPWAAAEYARVLQASVTFGAHATSFTCSRRDLIAASCTADPRLSELLEHLGAALPSAAAARGLVAEVREVVAELLGGRERLTLDQAGRRLAIGRRTLQRRLGQLGVSFAELLDDERRRAAFRLVIGTRRKLTDVAEQLGFASEAALYRAFRRWTGRTPAAFRA